MKRDIFNRAVRMQIPFGNTEDRNDPMKVNTFDPPLPLGKLAGRTPAIECQQYGEQGYRKESSPIQKPSGGFATCDGPAPDPSEQLSRPIPVGTKRRLGPLKTDK